MHKLRVKLNGTDVNPFERLGVRQNPFPQVAKYELNALCRLLNELAAVPIKDVDDLRRRMKGATPEFVDGCCARFRKGEVVEFDITFPE